MSLHPLTADTAPEIEQRQIEAWRHMSAAHKAAIVAALTRTALSLARAGVRHRYPDASERELFLRFAILMHGRDTAARVYPEIVTLGLE